MKHILSLSHFLTFSPPHLLTLSLSLLLSCSDLDPLPRGIEGRWRTLPPAHPEWQYDFAAPHLRQWIEDLGVIVTEQEYIYAVKEDSVFISGAGGQRVWLVAFPDDSTCIYRLAQPLHNSPPVTLRRVE